MINYTKIHCAFGQPILKNTWIYDTVYIKDIQTLKHWQWVVSQHVIHNGILSGGKMASSENNPSFKAFWQNQQKTCFWPLTNRNRLCYDI